MDFAKSMQNISDNDFNIITTARKTPLFHHEQPWMKKNEEEEFDVQIGCHDGAEIWEVIGTFILNKISPIMQEQNNVGLYRDDGLGIFRNLLWQYIETKKKEMIKIFKSFGLSITLTTNVTSANYLKVNVDLTEDIYKPYIANQMMNLFISVDIPTIPQTLYDIFHYE